MIISSNIEAIVECTLEWMTDRINNSFKLML